MIMNAIGGGGGAAKNDIITVAGGAFAASNGATVLNVAGSGRLYYCSHYVRTNPASGPIEVKVSIDGKVFYHVSLKTDSGVYYLLGGIINVPYLVTLSNNQLKQFGPSSQFTLFPSGTVNYEPWSGLKECYQPVTGWPVVIVNGFIEFKESLVIELINNIYLESNFDIGYTLDD